MASLLGWRDMSRDRQENPGMQPRHAQEKATVKRSIPVTAIRENVPVMTLAGIAFGASYGHIVKLFGDHGPHGWVQYAGAATVDLLCIIAAEERQRDKRIRRPRRGRFVTWSAVVLIIGIAATLIANLATADPGPLGICVAAWPAAALLLAVSVLERRASFEAPAGTKVRRRGRSAGTGTEERQEAAPVPAQRIAEPAASTAPAPAVPAVPGEESPQPWTDDDLVAEARSQWVKHADMGVRLSQGRFEMALKESPRGGAGRSRVIEALKAVRAEMDGDGSPDVAVGQ
jgi:hypothetical protein